jgi:hypothetical protein
MTSGIVTTTYRYKPSTPEAGEAVDGLMTEPDRLRHGGARAQAPADPASCRTSLASCAAGYFTRPRATPTATVRATAC